MPKSGRCTPRSTKRCCSSAVGEETATILRTARAAASDIRAKAEEQASALLRDAQGRAEIITADADAAAARVGASAEESSANLREKVEEEAERIRSTARHEAEAVRQLADQERKMTVEAAQQIREQILSDLTRRRRVANTQIEQLRVGRERLLEAYVVVRRTLDEVTDELQRADGEARQAADAVAHRAAGRPGDDLLLDLSPGGDPPTSPVGVPPLPNEPQRVDEPTAQLEAVELEPVDLEPVELEHRPEPEHPGRPGSGTGSTEPGAAAPGTPGTFGATGSVAGDVAGADPVASLRAASPFDSQRDPVGGKGAQVVEAVDEVESVRVLPASAVAAPPRPERPKNGGRRGPPTARSPLGKSRPEEIPDEAPAVESPPVDSPPVDSQSVESRSVDLSAVEVETPQVIEAQEATTGEGQAEQGVDSIFARIRADRAGSLVKARGVLDDDPDAASAEAELELELELELEAEPEPKAKAEHEAEGRYPGAEDEPAGLAAVSEEPAPEEPISDGDEGYLQRRDEATTNIEVALSRRLKRALQDEQNDLLDRLRQVRGTPKAANLLAKPADQRSRYTTAARPQLDEAAGAGVVYAAGFGPPDAPAEAPPNVDDLAVALASAVTDPLRRRLQQAFAESAGDDQQVLIEALGGVYRECKTQRIEQVAGDHVTAAFSRGAFVAAPEGTRLRWLVEDLGGPCPDCDDNALAGGLAKGEEYPTGQVHPPAHAGCRCVLVPFED